MIKKSLKVLLSLWILYHLVGILIMPSPQSILVKNWAWLFRPYLNALTLNTTWNLFSPDPAPPSSIRIQLISSKFETGVKEWTLPPSLDHRTWDPRHSRDIYVMRYLILNESHISRFVIPWLCQRDGGVDEVALQFYTTQLPHLDVASHDRWNRWREMKQVVLVKEWRDYCAYEGEL